MDKIWSFDKVCEAKKWREKTAWKRDDMARILIFSRASEWTETHNGWPQDWKIVFPHFQQLLTEKFFSWTRNAPENCPNKINLVRSLLYALRKNSRAKLNWKLLLMILGQKTTRIALRCCMWKLDTTRKYQSTMVSWIPVTLNRFNFL